MSNINELRRELLGQMAVVERRIEKLREQIIDEPEVAPERQHPAFSAGVVDAIGNLSFQVGMLMGIVTKYKDAL